MISKIFPRTGLLRAVLPLVLLLFPLQLALADSNTSLHNPTFQHLREGVHRITLSNGLRVLLFRRTVAPVFAAHIWVKVGGVDEDLGVSGVSHMLEHMAFKGTTTIGTKDYQREQPLLDRLDELMKVRDNTVNADPKVDAEIKSINEQLKKLWMDNEYARLYEKRGAEDLNAATSKDETYYKVELPSVAFEFWCWMESDRLLNPIFRQFYNEREVVLEERRMRVDNDPEGRLYESMLATAFAQSPYRVPTIGWPSDVKHLSTDDLKKLYAKYYVPENMVIALVGDIDEQAARPMLERYFGRLPQGTKPIIRTISKEEPQVGERHVEVLFDANPSFMIAFHKPVFPQSKDDAYFAVLHEILAGGRASLLYRELVQRRQHAITVATSEAPGERYPSVFYVYASPRDGISNANLRDEVQTLLDGLKTSRVADSEIVAAKRKILANFIKSISSNDGLAETLAHAELIWGDWQEEFRLQDIINETTPDDIQRLAKTYFKNYNRTYAHLEKTTAKQ